MISYTNFRLHHGYIEQIEFKIKWIRLSVLWKFNILMHWHRISNVSMMMMMKMMMWDGDLSKIHGSIDQQFSPKDTRFDPSQNWHFFKRLANFHIT